jgi:ABC-type transporter Mla subunit MlaD
MSCWGCCTDRPSPDQIADEALAQLRPALDKLNGVLTIVDNRKERVQKAIKLLNAYAMSLSQQDRTGTRLAARTDPRVGSSSGRLLSC